MSTLSLVTNTAISHKNNNQIKIHIEKINEDENVTWISIAKRTQIVMTACIQIVINSSIDIEFDNTTLTLTFGTTVLVVLNTRELHASCRENLYAWVYYQ